MSTTQHIIAKYWLLYNIHFEMFVNEFRTKNLLIKSRVIVWKCIINQLALIIFIDANASSNIHKIFIRKCHIPNSLFTIFR